MAVSPQWGGVPGGWEETSELHGNEGIVERFDRELLPAEALEDAGVQEKLAWNSQGRIYEFGHYASREYYQVVAKKQANDKETTMTPSGKSLFVRRLKQISTIVCDRPGGGFTIDRPRGIGKFAKHSKILTARIKKSRHPTQDSCLISVPGRNFGLTHVWDGKTSARFFAD